MTLTISNNSAAVPGSWAQSKNQLDATLTGIFSQTGPVGGADGSEGSAAHAYILINSLMGMMPSQSLQDTEAALIFVNSNLQNQESGNTVDSERNQEQIQQELIKEQQQQIADAQAKLQQANSDTSNESIWDKIQLALQWLAAIVSLVVGVTLCALGAGFIGAMLVVGGVTGILGAINSSMQMATGLGIAGSVSEETGHSKQQAEAADQDFGYAMIAVTVATAIVGFTGSFVNLGEVAMTLSESISSCISETAEDAAEGAGETEATLSSRLSAAAKNTDEISDTAKMLDRGNALGQGIVAAAQGAGSGYASYLSYDATQMQGEGQEYTAEQKEEQAVIDQLTQSIKAVIENMDAAFKAISADFSEFMQTLNGFTSAMANVKFSG